MRRRYEEMTSTDLAARTDMAAAIAVVPIAAIEQHGPHLPLGTDALIADHMIETVLPLLPDDLVATFLPVMRVGASAEHGGFAGTLDQGWRQAAEGLISVGEGLASAGFRRLVVVSSHGGNTPAMETAALELRRTHGLLVATCNWMRFGTPPGLLPETELAHGIHGGAVETALMLHFRPDLVRGDALANFPSLQAELERAATKLRAHGRLGFGWMAGDLNPSGVVGDTRLATAEIGRAIAEHQARGVAELMGDVARFDLGRLV